MTAASYRGEVTHPDYSHQAAVLIACSGPAQSADTGVGPVGPFTSKAQAQLEYAIADVTAWARHTHTSPPPMGSECLRHRTVLLEATRWDVLEAVAEANDRLNTHNDHSRGGTLDLFYSGHGDPDGNLVLADGPFAPDELAEIWGRGNRSGDCRHVRLVLDCCHAGMTLARLIVHRGHCSTYVLRDAWAACLPNEEAYELARLGHGVLTYTQLREDSLASMNRIRGEDREPTVEEIKQMQRVNRESIHFLTNGRQHGLDLVNGHFVSVIGKRGTALEFGDRRWPLEELVGALNDLPGTRAGPA